MNHIDYTPKRELDDYHIIPAEISRVKSRMECNPYNEDTMLPIMAAPMSSIIDENNIDIFLDNRIYAFIPRSVPYHVRVEHLINKYHPIAVSLEEFSKLFIEENNLNGDVLIDCANGHMLTIYDIAKEMKEHNPDIRIFAGNIANPETYKFLCKNYSGVLSGIRVGIGTGSVCATSNNTGIHYPMGSLLEEICHYKRHHVDDSIPVIADGGFITYSRVVKAIAMGCDYVMTGRLFASCADACGKPDEFGKRDYYGMSTERAQNEIGGGRIRPSEGRIDYIYVNNDYHISDVAEELSGYIRSAMSYCGTKTLNSFRDFSNMVVSK